MSDKKKILIVGANSQDSIILSKGLSSEKNTIYATTRETNLKLSRYRILFPNNNVIYVKDYSRDFFATLFESITFDQIYIFSSISNVYDKKYTENEYIESTYGLVKNLCDALESSHKKHDCIIFNSSSVEMFGKNLVGQQNENTVLNPESPYAVGKVLSHLLLKELRESGKFSTVNGIMYNHESIYRAEHFVTQKICKGVADIERQRIKKIRLGSVDVFRDWSFAGDIISAAKYAMDNKLSGDYVLASGMTRPLSNWLEISFAAIGIKEWENYIIHDPVLKRDAKEYIPNADISKAQNLLKLDNTLSFNDLVTNMVEHNLRNKGV